MIPLALAMIDAHVAEALAQHDEREVAALTRDLVDIASPVGYLNSQIYALTAPLLLLIFAIGAGAGAVAGEEERGTLELVVAQPLRRRDYVLQRFLALAALLAVLTVTLLATVALGSRLVDLEIGFGRLLAASISVGLLALLFAAIALAVGATRPGRARARPWTTSRTSRAGAPTRPTASRCASPPLSLSSLSSPPQARRPGSEASAGGSADLRRKYPPDSRSTLRAPSTPTTRAGVAAAGPPTARKPTSTS